MKVQATLKNLRIAPRKVRLVTHALIGVDTREALLQLGKMVKKSSLPLSVLLKSAVANASNNCGLDEENLYVYSIAVGDGPRLERWLPRAFGRATPLIRRGSNVTITLEERVEGKNRTAKKEPENKTAVKEKEGVVQEAEVVSGETEAKEGKEAPKTAKPEFKKDLLRGVRSSGSKMVKKMFQRKSS